MQAILETLTDPPSLEVGQKQNLCHFSIFKDVPQEAKDALVAQAVTDPKLDRAVGSMVGMAVVDAVGHWYEFLPALAQVDEPYSSGHGFSLAAFKDREQSGQKAFTAPHNRFDLALGQWTDDCSMGLCMADSLIMRRGYDGSDIRQRFWNWWNNGYDNAFRKDPMRNNSVGLGGNISQSIFSCKHGETPTPRYNAENNDAGNGSLMRLAPVPVFYHREIEAAQDFSAESSLTTHPGPAGDIVSSGGGGLSTGELPYREGDRVRRGPFRRSCSSQSSQASWNWKHPKLQIEQTLKNRGRSYNGYPVSAGYWGSYCMDGLAVALWAVRHTNSFDECVERVVNVLGDSDSHGSIAGQIAGSIYGYSSLHPRFVEYLNKWDDGEVALRAVLLYQLGPGGDDGEPAAKGEDSEH